MQFSTFSFAQQHNVRAFEQNGIAWFVAADICTALELTNSSAAISVLDEDEKSEMEIQTAGGKQTVRIINESGLYILILRSRQAMTKGTTAWKFRKWVTAEVLPAIRQTGSYTQGSLKISPAQKQQIQAAVMARHHRTGEHWQEIYRKLHAYCRVNSYHEIPAEQFQTALNYLGSIENAPAYRQPEKPQLTDSEIHALSVCARYLHDSMAFLRCLYRPLRDVNSPMAGRAFSLSQEPHSWLKTSKTALVRLTGSLKDPQPTRLVLERIGA